MKKIYKLLIFMFVVFALICTSVSVNGSDNIPDLEENTEIIEETPQPSEFALWVEENVIPIIIGTGTGFSLLGVGLAYIISWLKKKTKEMIEERKTTNEIHNHSTISLNEFRDELKQSLTDLIRSMNLTNEQSKDALDKVNEFVSSVDKRFENITILQKSIVDTIKLLATNIPEIVRNGTAERIMKIFESVKVISNDKNQSELKSEKA